MADGSQGELPIGEEVEYDNLGRIMTLPGKYAGGGKLESGQKIYTENLSRHVTSYIRRSGVGKPGSCHLFRHTMATLMLEGGADIRHV